METFKFGAFGEREASRAQQHFPAFSAAAAAGDGRRTPLCALPLTFSYTLKHKGLLRKASLEQCCFSMTFLMDPGG